MSARLNRRKPDQGRDRQEEILDVMGTPTIVKFDPAAAMRLFVAERTFPPGHCSPVHSHDEDDVLIYMLEGELTVVKEGQEQRAGPGVCVALPRGQARAYRNECETAARGLIISQPGIQAVELFRNLDRASRASRSAGRSLSDNDIDQIAGQYGVQVERN